MSERGLFGTVFSSSHNTLVHTHTHTHTQNLNVYVPRNNKSSKAFPAMIWLYGGAFEEGMNWGPVNLYQGTQFAAKERVCIGTY
jgi:carboxylesterase type B